MRTRVMEKGGEEKSDSNMRGSLVSKSPYPLYRIQYIPKILDICKRNITKQVSKKDERPFLVDNTW